MEKTKGLKKLFCKVCSLAMAGLLVFGAVPAASFADDGAAGTQAKAQAAAAVNADAALQNKYNKSDMVTFRKEYFMQSSYIDNIHLAELSVWASYVSTSYYDPGKDPRQTDPSKNALNLMNMLEDKGFQDVEANEYYSVEGLENSIAVVVGRMTIEKNGKPYTLLAVIPRSVGYKQEWAGNFYVGNNGMHNGFRGARDEVLRFVKKYVDEHGVTGDVKIWTAGQSRGAAVANMVGGFFAGGGAEYLGEGVTIAPTDVYSYCFATPYLVQNGLSKADELSVGGARGGRYANDTAGEAFTSTNSGKVDTSAAVYRGIKNFLIDEDPISRVPSTDWKYTYYGVTDSANKGCTWNEMMAELSQFAPTMYEQYKAGADPAGFKYYRLDLSNLAIVPDEKKTGGTLKSYLDERTEAFYNVITSNKYYVESGQQDALMAVGGISGMLLAVNLDYLYSDLGIEKIKAGEFDKQTAMYLVQFIKPGLLSLFAYAAERIKAEKHAEGVEISDAEALGIYFADACKYISGLRIPEEPTVDYMVHAMAEFIALNKDSELLDQLINQMLTESGFQLDDQIRQILKVFTPTAKWDEVTDVEMIKNVLVACSRGPQMGTIARVKLKNGAAVRAELYSNAGAILSKFPELEKAIDNGNGSLTNVSAALIDILAGNGQGETRMTLDQAADAEVAAAIGNLFYPAAAKAQELYGFQYPEYQSDASNHIDTLIKNVNCARRAFSYLMFHTEGEKFTVESTISAACTLFGNASMLMPAHYCESYVAWIRAKARKIPFVPADERKAQSLKVTAVKGTAKTSALKKKKKVLTLIKVKNSKGTVRYKKKSGSGKLAVNKKTGKITVKKKTKKGTYKIRVTVTASGNTAYKAASRTVTVTVKVK